MKRSFVIIASVGGVALFIYAAWFAFAYLRGAGPAVLPPADTTITDPDATGGSQPGSDSYPGPAENDTGIPLTVPDGLRISVFAQGLTNPRVLARDPGGVLMVSQPAAGKVTVLPDADGDGKVETVGTVISGLNSPHGLAFHEGNLYIAETDGVSVYAYRTEDTKAVNEKRIIALPGGGNHFSRTIGFGPDNRLYITVGSSCNACNETDKRRAAMHVANADGTGLGEYASGLRNTVFFTWHPVTGELWGTDMGRDLIGDDVPPDEINIIRQGGFYGWPYCYGKNVQDTDFDGTPDGARQCAGAMASAIEVPAHSAPLGLAFIPESWPEQYRGDLLVAYHGSWNRTEPTGYKIVRVLLDERGNFEGIEDFITGWLGDATRASGALGRPVDLLFDQGGTLYISDDKAGRVYTLSIK